MDNELAFKLQRIKWPLIIAGFMFLAAVAICSVSLHFYNDLKQTSSNTKLAIQDQHNQLDEQQMLNRIRDEYVAQFEQLNARGFFQDDLKLRWLESINNASQNFALSSVRYDIGARMLYEHEAPLDSSLKVYKTTIDLRFGMLHEGDLASVAAFFAAENLGLYQTNSCEVIRLNDALPVKPDELYVNAHCLFSVYEFSFDANDQSHDPFDPNEFAMAN